MSSTRSLLILVSIAGVLAASPAAAAGGPQGWGGAALQLGPTPDGVYGIPDGEGDFLPLRFEPQDSGFRLDHVRFNLKTRQLELRFTYTGEKVVTAMATQLAQMSATDELVSATTFTEDWADTVEFKDGRIKRHVEGLLHEKGALLRGQMQDVTGFGLPKPGPAETPAVDHLRVTIPVVVFADASFAGSPRLARRILGSRKAEAEELAYWLARLERLSAADTDDELIAGVTRLLGEMQDEAPELSNPARTVRNNLRSNLNGFGSRQSSGFQSPREELRDLLDWYGDRLEEKRRQVPVDLPQLPQPTAEGENRIDQRLIGEGDSGDDPDCECGGSILASVGRAQTRNCGEPWVVTETWNFSCQGEFGTGLSGTMMLRGTGACLEGVPCFPDKYCPPEFTPVSEHEDLDYHYWFRGVSDQTLDVSPLCTARCANGQDRSIAFKCPCSPTPEPSCRIDGCPILIETGTAGFRLTDFADGVHFDLDADGVAEPLSWPQAGTDDAWLALDRDGSGTIDNGLELFGNATPQPPSSEPNGFLALAVFDRPEQGGDGDGQITAGDAVFADLLLWLDRDHDGVSDPSELSTLTDAGIVALELEYHESRRRDRYGNEFRYAAGVWHANGARRLAQDVFLLVH